MKFVDASKAANTLLHTQPWPRWEVVSNIKYSCQPSWAHQSGWSHHSQVNVNHARRCHSWL